MTSDIPIGYVRDLLIEDGVWVVRYVVVDLISILPNRSFLISPFAVRHFDFSRKALLTNLTSDQVLKSDPENQHESISRLHEKALVEYYGWPLYWLGRAAQFSPQTLERMANGDLPKAVEEQSSSKLRSAAELCGYRINANDESIGLIHDLEIDEETWNLKSITSADHTCQPDSYFVSKTEQIEKVDWSNRKLTLNVPKAILNKTGASLRSAKIAGEPLTSQSELYH